MTSQDTPQELSARELSMLLMAGQIMSHEQHEERICQWACDSVASSTEATFAAIALAPEEGTDLRAVYCSAGDSSLADSLTIEIAELVGIEWPRSEPPGRVTTLDGMRIPPALAEEGISQLARVEIRSIAQQLGVLLVGMGASWKPNDRDNFILTTLTNQLAIALENTRSRSRAIEQARILEALALENEVMATIGRIVSASPSITDVYQSFAQEAHKLISFDRMALGVVDIKTWEFVQGYVSGSEVSEREIGTRNTLEGTFSEEVIQTRKAKIFAAETQEELATKYPGFLPAFRAGVRTNMSVPLLYHGEVVAVLHFTSFESNAFTQEDLDVAERIGAQITGAIVNSTLYEELQRTEQQAQIEHQRLQLLVESCPIAILVVDSDFKVVLANSEVQRIFGELPRPGDSLEHYGRAVVGRHPDGGVYQPEDLPIRRALNTGERIRAEEIHVELPDGRRIPTLINAIPIYSREGKIDGAISIIQDITALEEIQQLRSEFIGIVSHELRTPIATVKGATAAALGSRRPLTATETDEILRIVDEQADRLRDMVDNFLDTSRIESGTISINPEPADLKSILRDASESFARSGYANEVTLNLSGDVPVVKADRARIVQVVLNLLSNASKYSPPGSLIEMEAESSQMYVTVHVRDQGRGIAPENLPLLFRKFSRINQGEDYSNSGVGLGLVISRGIVEAHGGRVWAESPGEGLGSTFSFTLLISEEPVASEESVPERIVHRDARQPRILAVDDEPRTLRYLQRSLEEADYQVIVTSNPSEVLDKIEGEGPDIVILDLYLPGLTGFELLQRTREFSNVPVIILTSSTEGENVVRALDMGADDYITKPFSPTELVARIEAVLRRRALSQGSALQSGFSLDDLTINFTDRLVTISGGEVNLTSTEYRLLYELATNAGRVLTYDQILERVWDSQDSGDVRLVHSFIRDLRRKLGDDARNPLYIITQRGVGYMMPSL